MNIKMYEAIVETIKFHLQDIGYESSMINKKEVLGEIDGLFGEKDENQNIKKVHIISHQHIGLKLFELSLNSEGKAEEKVEEMELILTIHLDSENIDFSIKDIIVSEIIETLTKETLIESGIEETEVSDYEFMKKIFSRVEKVKFTLLFLTNSVMGSLKAENILSYEKKQAEIISLKSLINNKLKEFIGNFDINVIFDYYSLENSVKQKYTISVNSRTFVASSKGDNDLSYKGKVYTAKLKDLVNLFESKGKQLFVKNIRLGIENLMNVDTAINDTLLNKPQEFWFLNNGITMLVPIDKINDNNNDFIVIDNCNNELLTVINGAQTITSAANFYLKENLYSHLKNDIEPIIITLKEKETLDVKEKKKLESLMEIQREIYKYNESLTDAKDRAYVMLKLVEVNESDKEIENKITEITVSLNRQKPVGPTDIAYTLPIIHEINKLYKTNVTDEALKNYLFSIVRRGDVSSTNNNIYTLNVLPRILKAINDSKPGKAMSMGIKTLMKISNDNNTFVDKSIFPVLDGSEELINEELFEEKYKYVNFAMKLYDELENYQKTIDDTYEPISFENEPVPMQIAKEDFNKFIKYSRYVMLYLIIMSLNENKKDFSGWNYSRLDVLKFLNQQTYYQIAYYIAQHWEKFIEEYAEIEAKKDKKGKKDKIELKGKEKWQVNVFKKDLVIDKILEEVHGELKTFISNKINVTDLLESKKLIPV